MAGAGGVTAPGLRVKRTYHSGIILRGGEWVGFGDGFQIRISVQEIIYL